MTADSLRIASLWAVGPLMLLLAADAYAQAPAIPNGGFESDGNGDGLADEWDAPHDPGVTVETALEPGVQGQCQRLACTRFERQSPASHAMLAQTRDLGLVVGNWYRLSFYAKQRGIAGRAVDVAMSDTTDWENAGLSGSFRATDEWKPVEFTFQAKRAGDRIRLQIWYLSRGTLWLDEVKLEPAEPQRTRYTTPAPATGVRNLLANGGFECGEAGWGSIADVPGWGGNLNRLIGQVDDDVASEGKRSMRIALDRASVPVYYFDYYDLYRFPITAPWLANRGWVDVAPGESYILSFDARADRAGLRGGARAYPAFQGTVRKDIEFGTDWQRYALAFTPQADQVFVAMGLDLDASGADAGTVWIDAVQLERGDSPTEYVQPPTQVAVWCPALGHVFRVGDEPFVELRRTSGEQGVSVQVRVTDFWDKVCYEKDIALAPGADPKVVRASLPLRDRGVYRVAAAAPDAVVLPVQSLRIAVLEPYQHDDSVFAMNHAYPWPELVDLSCRMGITWFRDWSLKWHDVEPEPGQFDFGETDAQIDRVLERGAHVLPLLPFPSSYWASRTPVTVTDAQDEGQGLASAAEMPGDLDAMANYVRRTVEHYRDRLSVWEILNEPVYTQYALPRAKGYTVEDYVRFLTRASAAVHAADPKALVIGGLAGPPDLLTKEFIAAGGLDLVDVLNLHAYPGATAPEALSDGMAELRAAMQAAGRDLPIWFTEGAYYGDDDPPRRPYDSWLKLLDSESECAVYQTKLNAILLAHGTQRIVYHSGTPGDVNDDDDAGIFFEWNGAPRKMVASQSAMANIVGAGPIRGRGRLAAPEGIYAYGLDSGDRTIVVAWQSDEVEGDGPPIRAKGGRLFDLLGNPLDGRTARVTPTPAYVEFGAVASDDELRGLWQ